MARISDKIVRRAFDDRLAHDDVTGRADQVAVEEKQLDVVFERALCLGAVVES